MSVAVVLMASGSPNRIEDVPAYYADIRGGRPIKPELLEDLVARYKRLGIEESNPLNEITEATRAALEAELGLPVFTGMRHWTPRIAEAVERALATGADAIVGLVLAPHYSSMSIERYRAQLVEALDDRAELHFVERWGDEPGFVADHLEIRWDLDVEAAEKAQELGLRLDRIELPNADPAFVRVLAGLVRRAPAVPSQA